MSLRTNKYYVMGAIVVKNHLLSQTQQPTVIPFSTDITVTDITNDTSASDLLSHIKNVTIKILSAEQKKEIDPKTVNFGLISIIDSFQQSKPQ